MASWRFMFVAATTRTLVFCTFDEPTRIYSPVCKHAQQARLRRMRQFGHLVQEDRAAVSLLEIPLAGLQRRR